MPNCHNDTGASQANTQKIRYINKQLAGKYPAGVSAISKIVNKIHYCVHH